MKRMTTLLVAGFLVLGLIGCEESTITGTLGNESIQGSVVMSGELSGADPSDIEVRAPGTGKTAFTNAAGEFRLDGLPAGELELLFRRGDGIEETRTVSTALESVTVELTGRRGRGRPVAKPGQSVQGEIVEVRESSIVVDAVIGGETEILIDENTFIFKGAVTLLIGDLEAGNMVHVRAWENEESALVAQSIAVSPRHAGDPTFLPRSAVGEIVAIGENQLTVLTSEGIEVIVNVDERTEFYKKNLLLEFEDLEVGDRVKVFGVRLEDESLLASWIRVKPGEGGDEEDEGEEEEEELDGSVHGEVLSVGENTLVVRDGEGLEVTVEVTDSTEIKKRGRSISFDEIEAGNFVTAIGERVDETNLVARKINVTG